MANRFTTFPESWWAYMPKPFKLLSDDLKALEAIVAAGGSGTPAAVPYEMWVDGSNRYGLTTEFTGGGVATPNSDGTITYAPAWANGSETRAVLIRSDQEWMGDVTIDARIATLEQRPTGANPWEVGWLMWNYTRASSSTPTQGVGNTDLWARKCYYFALKPNGWELGKLDQENLTGSGGQRFLATGSTPTYPIGSVHDVRITQTGTTITVTVDGQQLTQTTDSSATYPWVAGESAYTSGAVAMYCEDAKVKVSRLSVTQSAHPTVVVPLDAAAEPVALPSYDDTVIADGPSMFLRDGAADVVNTSRSVSTFGATATAANLPGGGKSLVFPGTSGAYVQVPSTPDVQCAALGALTVEAWITRTPGDLSIGEDDGSGEGIKVNFAGVLWYDTVNRVQWEWRTYKEKLANSAAAPRAKRWSVYMFAPNGGLGTGSYYQEGVGTMQPLPDGVPFHLVAVYDDTQAMRDKTNGWGRVTQYINGVQVDTDPFSNYQTRPALVDAPLRIGTSDGWSWFAGAVGKFATYKRALTAAEVADHYAAMIRAAV